MLVYVCVCVCFRLGIHVYLLMPVSARCVLCVEGCECVRGEVGGMAVVVEERVGL